MANRSHLGSPPTSVPQKHVVKSVQKTLALTFYIGCWYAANILFNIYNKRILKVFPLFATVTLVQFLMGWSPCEMRRLNTHSFSLNRFPSSIGAMDNKTASLSKSVHGRFKENISACVISFGWQRTYQY